jgi:dihydropyrimidine dehydrogenase (NAD+) subunit PreT
VALVGAGPASLACAAELALAGHQAIIYEAKPVPGGLNTTGIAPYKLQADDALDEVEWVKSLGIEIRQKRITSVNGSELLADHDAVFIGMGLGNDTHLGLPNEQGPGVHGATAWIEELKLQAATGEPKLGRVVVVGGGNTALDCARECARLGAEDVVLVYRRGVDEMSGYAHELEAARTEGVRIHSHAVPVGFVRDDAKTLKGLRIAKAHAGKPIPGTEFEIGCDLVLVAIGQGKMRALLEAFPGVAVDDRGCIVANPATGATGNPKVFSGGDCINGGKEVVNAVADGRNAARELLRRWADAR